MLDGELEDKLNQIDPNGVFSVARCLKTHKEGNVTFYKDQVYVFNLDQETGKPILLLTLFPSCYRQLGPNDHWTVTTADADVNAYSAEVLDVYIKVLQIVKQYLVEKDEKMKNDIRAE